MAELCDIMFGKSWRNCITVCWESHVLSVKVGWESHGGTMKVGQESHGGTVLQYVKKAFARGFFVEAIDFITGLRRCKIHQN